MNERLVPGECACDVCGFQFYAGDRANCVEENDTLRWYCEGCFILTQTPTLPIEVGSRCKITGKLGGEWAKYANTIATIKEGIGGNAWRVKENKAIWHTSELTRICEGVETEG